MKNRLINIDGVINFRDLGGYQGAGRKTVVWGRIFRSAQLNELSDDGVSKAADLGIGTVVDLRFDDETERYPTVRQAFPRAEFISWQSELVARDDQPASSMKRSWRESLDSGDAAQVREAMRVNYPVKLYSHQDVYRQMLLRLINEEAPLLFHCAAGKDRTGVAAALILSLLGVSYEDIVQDYLISQGQVAHLLQNWVAGGAANAKQQTSNSANGSSHDSQDFQHRLSQYPREVVQPVFDADLTYIETLLDYVDRTYAGFENYATKVLRLDSAQLDGLRANLLVD